MPMSTFLALFTTDDGRLVKGKEYRGHLLKGLNRICIIDELEEPMTFNCKALQQLKYGLLERKIWPKGHPQAPKPIEHDIDPMVDL